MVDSNDCPLGRENRARINNLERIVDDVASCVKELTNHYSQRMSLSLTIFIMALSNTLTGLVVYLVTH